MNESIRVACALWVFILRGWLVARPFEHLVRLEDLESYADTAKRLGLDCEVICEEGDHYYPADQDMYPFDIEPGRVIISVDLKDLTPWDFFKSFHKLNDQQTFADIPLTESLVATNA